MGKFIDLTGKQSGVLIAKKYLGDSQWDCECIICGNHITISTYWFNKNIKLIKSGFNRVGCKHIKDVKIGDSFGYLSVVAQDSDYVKPKSGSHEKRWICQCVCGKKKSIIESNLKSLKSTSCGLCGNQISVPEKAILFYLSRAFSNIQENYRPDFLQGKEIDIYIQELGLGIEYDGERWHKEVDKDIWKNQVCNNNGITLVRIREPKCIVREELNPYIITPKPITNGTHMTEPIRQLIEFINRKFQMELEIDVNCLRDNAEICKTVLNSSQSKSLADLFPEIAQEWDYEKNAPLTPKMVAAHSGKKAYWICEKGHKYSSVIASRTGGDACGCTVCSNHGMALYQNGTYIGQHSLAKEAPEIAKEFDEEKNGITADNIAISSNKKMWWKCSVCDFEWQSKVNNRTSTLKTGCPNCARTQGKLWKTRRANEILKNGSLFDNFTELCKEWDYEKNEVQPTEFTSGSAQKVWWKCEKGHSYQASINKKTSSRSTGCPYCLNRKVLVGYNDFATTHPHLLSEWNYEKNNILPMEILPGSHQKVWWKCYYCGENYELSPEKRKDRRLGCSCCRRKMRSTSKKD